MRKISTVLYGQGTRQPLASKMNRWLSLRSLISRSHLFFSALQRNLEPLQIGLNGLPVAPDLI